MIMINLRQKMPISLYETCLFFIRMSSIIYVISRLTLIILYRSFLLPALSPMLLFIRFMSLSLRPICLFTLWTPQFWSQKLANPYLVGISVWVNGWNLFLQVLQLYNVWFLIVFMENSWLGGNHISFYIWNS